MTKQLLTIFALLAACELLVACENSVASTSIGSNTNWLERCSADRDCDGAFGCRCGVCTNDCSVEADCEALGSARCTATTAPGAWATCGTRLPPLSSGVCLPRCEPGTCKDDQACVGGVCAPVALVDNEFCAPVQHRSEVDRAAEDHLLIELHSLREVGGVSCGGAAPSASAPLWRLDARLLCAARVHVIEMEETRSLNVIDALGRNTEDRMALAGYASRRWGESFAFGTTAPEAFGRMLSDVDSCQRFTDAAFVDLGVGTSGDSYIVTLGSE